jgi:hypothetical protein
MLTFRALDWVWDGQPLRPIVRLERVRVAVVDILVLRPQPISQHDMACSVLLPQLHAFLHLVHVQGIGTQLGGDEWTVASVQAARHTATDTGVRQCVISCCTVASSSIYRACCSLRHVLVSVAFHVLAVHGVACVHPPQGSSCADFDCGWRCRGPAMLATLASPRRRRSRGWCRRRSRRRGGCRRRSSRRCGLRRRSCIRESCLFDHRQKTLGAGVAPFAHCELAHLLLTESPCMHQLEHFLLENSHGVRVRGEPARRCTSITNYAFFLLSHVVCAHACNSRPWLWERKLTSRARVILRVEEQSRRAPPSACTSRASCWGRDKCACEIEPTRCAIQRRCD